MKSKMSLLLGCCFCVTGLVNAEKLQLSGDAFELSLDFGKSAIKVGDDRAASEMINKLIGRLISSLEGAESLNDEIRSVYTKGSKEFVEQNYASAEAIAKSAVYLKAWSGFKVLFSQTKEAGKLVYFCEVKNFGSMRTVFPFEIHEVEKGVFLIHTVNEEGYTPNTLAMDFLSRFPKVKLRKEE